MKRRLNPKIRVREDEHDVLQSMFKSFFGMQPGHDKPFLASRGELWKFLVWMAMCKVANAAHKHQAHRRDVRREQPLGLPDFSDPLLASWMAEVSDRGRLSPEEAAISREEFDRLLLQLAEPLQQIFVWRLQGHTNAEIARMINRTERTVELKMKIIRKTLELAPHSEHSVPRPGASSRNDRQDHLRRVARIVIDGVVGRDHPAVVAQRVAGVRVHVEPRVVAARDVDADAVALLEDVGGRVERDRDRARPRPGSSGAA